MKELKRTTAPVERGDFTGLSPEFGRVPDVQKLFGIKRGCCYALLRDGKIRGALLRVKGRKSGVRLISIPSVRDYINSQMEGRRA